MPRIAQPTLSPLEPTSILRAEFQTPLPDALVGDNDPPLCQEIFDISEAQAEAVIEPDGVTDDFGRETVSAVVGGMPVHLPSLAVPA